MIPSEYKDRILRHAFSVLTSDEYPMLLAIQGPPGVGKSYQTYNTLRRSHFFVLRVSASFFSGGYEGDSVEKFTELYAKARRCVLDDGLPNPAILIEDFDLSGAAKRDSTEYTVNQQLLIAHLMNLCDGVDSESGKVVRVPIYLTGNDFTVIHGPLCRRGRMDVFNWNPRREVLVDILGAAFSRFTPSSQHAADIIYDRLRGATLAEIMDCVHQAASRYHYGQLKETGRLGLARMSDIQISAYTNVPLETFVNDVIAESQMVVDIRDCMRDLERS